MHPAALSESALLADCSVRRQRRSGPGGQHRNKVETAVVITHGPTGIVGEASERRSQAENRSRALHRLRLNLALAVRTPCADQVPSWLWQSRCRRGKIAVRRDHADFPAILAEVLDLLADVSLDFPRAAGRLGCSASQIVKLLQVEPRALQQVNDGRQAIGLRPLR